jgi:tetratricopeptide (TPR) repeat protein
VCSNVCTNATFRDWQKHWWLLRGNCYYWTFELDKALADYDKAIEMGETDCEMFLRYGEIFLRQGKLDEAMEQVGKAQGGERTDNEFAKALCLRGLIKYDKGLLDASGRDFDRAVAKDPNCGDAHVCKGVFLMRKGREVEAIESMNKGVELAPDNILLKIKRAAALDSCGKWVEAAQDASAVIKANYRVPEAKEILIKFKIGSQGRMESLQQTQACIAVQ